MVRVKGNAYIYLALLLLLVPIHWLVAWLVSVIFHEICHYLIIRLFGGRVDKLTIGLGGAEMECRTLSKYQSVMAILAGPVGGLLLTLTGRWFPQIALCSGILSVYNILPLSFLDGGRVLLIILGERIGRLVEAVCLCVLTMTALYLSFATDFGILPIGIVIGLWLKKAKSSCKESSFKVQ